MDSSSIGRCELMTFMYLLIDTIYAWNVTGNEGKGTVYSVQAIVT